MQKFSRISILAVAILLVASHAHAQAVDLAPYFNLDPGRQFLIVEVVDDGSGLVMEDIHIESLTDLGGGVTGELALFSPGWTLEDVGLWKKETDGHYLLGYIETDTGETEVHAPPLGPVDGLMTIGVPLVRECWMVKDGVPDSLQRFEITLLATGVSYQTAAGVFEDCAVIQVDISVSSVLVQQVYLVWAKDVGEILDFEFVNDGGSMVLQSIHITVDILNLP